MSKKIQLILIFLSIFKQMNSIKSKDLCFIANETNETTSVDLSQCFGEYNYPCGPSHCTTNRVICQHISMLFSAFGKIQNSIDGHSMILSYLIFLKSIQNCPKYILKPEDACINGVKCFYIHKVPYRLSNRKHTLIEHKECACGDAYHHKCGKYCTKHKLVCDEFNSIKDDLVIQSCGNNNTRVYSRF